MRKPYPTDLSDAEWRYIEPHLPSPRGFGRPRTNDLREILNAVFYLLKTGCQWRLLPHDFPRWPTVYWYFRKWRIEGTWERVNRAILERLRKPAPEEVLMAWAKEGVAVDRKKLLPSEGFLVLPRRWVVERTLSWIDQQRRMSLWTTRGCVRAGRPWCAARTPVRSP